MAQPGAIDPTFNPSDVGYGYGCGANGPISAMACQPDGKILIAGDFTHYNGTPRNGLARLNNDGALDSDFGTGPGAEGGSITSVLVLPNDKILIAGFFDTYDGTSRPTIARLNQDGSLDGSFDPGTGVDIGIFTLALQDDGKIWAGGIFFQYNGATCVNLARLDSNGSLDLGFDWMTAPDGAVSTIAVQTNGKILIGGDFTSVIGEPRIDIARLNPDGSLDDGFDPGSGPDDEVQCMAVQPDGKILIGGSFQNYDGTACGNFTRLTSTGGWDGTFNPGIGADNHVHAIELQADGMILIGGTFTAYGVTSRNHIARLNTDGSLASDFDPGIGPNAEVDALAAQADGHILAVGYFSSWNTSGCGGIARLSAQGALDTAFLPGPCTGANRHVSTTAIQADGRVLIGGGFGSFNGTWRNRIARLDAEGGLDTTFDPGTGADGEVNAIALASDGNILVAGWFDTYNGISRKYIARLNPDGGLDDQFDPGEGPDSPLNSLLLQPDGKILITGYFENVAGAARKYIARLNPDGTLDGGFDPGTGPNGGIQAFALQSDGRILIAGGFTMFNDLPRNHIARLNADGTLDETFDPGTGADISIGCLVLQPDGRVIIGGFFTNYDGTPRNNIARLNNDGSLDTTFDPGTGPDAGVSRIAMQADGAVIASGEFTTYDGTPRTRIVRITPDGGLDPTFDPGTGPDSWIASIVLQPDGKVILGGDFMSYNGTGRNRIARLNGGAVGIEEHDGPSVHVHPNPTTGALSVILPTAGERVDLRLLDNTGRELMTQRPISLAGKHSLDLSDRSTGLYFLEVRSADGTRTTVRMVKQ